MVAAGAALTLAAATRTANSTRDRDDVCMAQRSNFKTTSYRRYAAAVVAAPFRNASRSALIVSALVVGMP